MRKEKKGFNWSKYENGRDNETRKLVELLKSVYLAIGQSLQDEEEGNALLSAQVDGSTGGHDIHELKRAGIRELVKNEHVIELAELPNTPDRG